MILEIGTVKKAVDQILEEIGKTKFAFQSEWDDTVHTSFEQLIHDMDKYKNEMDEELFKLNNLKNHVVTLKDHIYFNNQISAQSTELGAIII